MMFILMIVALYLSTTICLVDGAVKNKPHSHQGLLEPYTGKPLPVQLTSDQRSKLERGEPVTYTERDGKSGFGVVVQDVNAPEVVCFSKISDLKNYHKMVPHVKRVEVYEENKLANGSTITGAKFNVGVMGMNIEYYLKLRHEPKYNTLSWTLDFRHTSDIDDSVGLWQVMPHPERKDWTRILYSTKIKLLPFIPEFAVRSFTTQALTEATGWVKKEAESEQKKRIAAANSTNNTSTENTISTGRSTCTSTACDGCIDKECKTKRSGFTLPRWFKNVNNTNCIKKKVIEEAEKPLSFIPKGWTERLLHNFRKST